MPAAASYNCGAGWRVRRCQRSDWKWRNVMERKPRIDVQGIDAIKNTGSDLRPRTVFVGPDNANKAWGAYAVCGFFRGISADLHNPPVHSAKSLDPAFLLPAGLNHAIAYVSDNLVAIQSQDTFTYLRREK